VVGLERHGAALGTPTLLGLLARTGTLLAPLLAAILGYSRQAEHLYADETSWKVFTPADGGAVQRWWLWVFITRHTICFVMDHSRGGQVLADHLGLEEQPNGSLTMRGDQDLRVLSSDFYAVYASAGRRCDALVNIWCVAHLRRRFREAWLSNPDQLEYWWKAWAARFRALYTDHEQLAAAWTAAHEFPGPQHDKALADAHTAWDDAANAIDTARREQQKSPGLQPKAKEAHATLERQWPGVLAYRDCPFLGIDSNIAERALRRPVVTRKNAYGSRNETAAERAAAFWTVIGTAEKHGLNALTYLTAYLDACGRAGGTAPQGTDLDRFLPCWQASPDDLEAWKQPPR